MRDQTTEKWLNLLTYDVTTNKEKKLVDNLVMKLKVNEMYDITQSKKNVKPFVFFSGDRKYL